jgi:hypothetical protein
MAMSHPSGVQGRAAHGDESHRAAKQHHAKNYHLFFFAQNDWPNIAQPDHYVHPHPPGIVGS